MRSLPLTRRIGECDVCGDESETVDNLLIECDRCGVMVHQACYGVASRETSSGWLCDVCRCVEGVWAGVEPAGSVQVCGGSEGRLRTRG